MKDWSYYDRMVHYEYDAKEPPDGDERTEEQRKADEAERDWWEEARAEAYRGW